jgi:hypothetical protein
MRTASSKRNLNFSQNFCIIRPSLSGGFLSVRFFFTVTSLLFLVCVANNLIGSPQIASFDASERLPIHSEFKANNLEFYVNEVKALMISNSKTNKLSFLMEIRINPYNLDYLGDRVNGVGIYYGHKLSNGSEMGQKIYAKEKIARNVFRVEIEEMFEPNIFPGENVEILPFVEFIRQDNSVVRLWHPMHGEGKDNFTFEEIFMNGYSANTHPINSFFPADNSPIYELRYRKEFEEQKDFDPCRSGFASNTW